MSAVKLRGFKRAFCNLSPHWDNTSPATLLRTGNLDDVVEGVALRMTQEEISTLDPFEGFPSWYNREDITLETYVRNGDELEQTTVQGQAYIQTSQDTFVEPCLNYKIACCKTLYMHKRLLNPQADTMIELDIVNGMTLEHVGLFMYSLSDEDITNL